MSTVWTLIQRSKQQMWHFALKSWWNLVTGLHPALKTASKKSFTFQQFVFIKSTTRLFNTRLFPTFLSTLIKQVRRQPKPWKLHTLQQHKIVSRSYLAPEFFSWTHFWETNASEKAYEKKTKKNLFISVFVSGGHVVPNSWVQRCSTSLKVVLLQNLKMQFVNHQLIQL